MSQYELPKVFTIADIKPENCIASARKEDLHENIVQSSQQYHHNMGWPCKPHEKGKFEIRLPVVLTSSVNETTGEDGKTKSYHIYAEIYGNYFQMQSKVASLVEKMLESVTGATTPDQLKTLLMSSLKKASLSKKPDEIEKIYNETMPRNQPLDVDWFRYIGLKVLIDDELLEDKKGTELMKFCRNLKKCYCDSLDSQAELRDKIYNGIGIAPEKLETPSAELVEDIAKWQKYAKDHAIFKNRIDYTKSPQIAIKWMESVPKIGGKRKPNAIVLSQKSGQILWTDVFDFVRHPLRQEEIKTFAELDHFIYRKDDSKNGVKSPFNLMQQIQVTTPSVYWGEKNKIGTFQFKGTRCHITQYITLGRTSSRMSSDEHQKLMMEVREAMEYYGTHQQPQENADDDIGGGVGGGSNDNMDVSGNPLKRSRGQGGYKSED
jgi:hypothetical protein